MNPLSNAVPPRGEAEPLNTGLTSDVFPEAKSSKTGVTSRYVPDPNKHWFAFRATYGREQKATDTMIELGAYPYLAKRYTKKFVKGKMKRVLEPLIPNLLFAYLTAEQADDFVNHTPDLIYLAYYYNQLDKNESGKGRPLIVPNHEMENFIKATHTSNEHMMMVDSSQCHFKSGDLVRVIAGEFEGVEGRVARVSGQQRVVISLSNVGLVSTAYIPSSFIEIVKE
jgi:transcription antitermination factor NusG